MMDGRKHELRAAMKARRRAVTPEARKAASEIICAKLASLNLHSPIAVYLASPQEIDLSPFIRKMLAMGVKVAAPRWNGETYELAVLKGLDDEHLRQGPMRILEPTEAEIVSPKEVEVWLVPGLAFTRNGKRLGYGGGWYDRLLAEAPKDALKIGIAHAFQVVDDLPSESHDILLSKVVTGRAAVASEVADGSCLLTERKRANLPNETASIHRTEKRQFTERG